MFFCKIKSVYYAVCQNFGIFSFFEKKRIAFKLESSVLKTQKNTSFFELDVSFFGRERWKISSSFRDPKTQTLWPHTHTPTHTHTHTHTHTLHFLLYQPLFPKRRVSHKLHHVIVKFYLKNLNVE